MSENIKAPIKFYGTDSEPEFTIASQMRQISLEALNIRPTLENEVQVRIRRPKI